jgi:predicted DNA-binding transcriptional regulator YafY
VADPPSTDDRFERLANLVTFLLDTDKGATFAEILEAIPGYPPGDDSARRAFERDKKLLRDEDIPLVEYDGRYRIPPSEYYLPDLGLTEAEQVALRLAVAAVPLGGGEGGGSALQKLTLGGSEGGSGPTLSLAADLEEHPLLPVLHGAIRRRSLVTFSHGGVARTVEPAMLFFRDGNWYLHGFDRVRSAERNFRVDRIDSSSVAVGDVRSFVRRPSAPSSSEAAMPREPWLIGGDDSSPSESAVVRVDAVLAGKAVAEAGSSASVERHDDGSVTITMPVVQRAAFRSWVLGLLDHAEVVGPPALRGWIVSWLESIAGAGG